MWANNNFGLGMDLRKGIRKTVGTDEARRDLTIILGWVWTREKD
jgi:hypothetical protein